MHHQKDSPTWVAINASILFFFGSVWIFFARVSSISSFSSSIAGDDRVYLPLLRSSSSKQLLVWLEQPWELRHAAGLDRAGSKMGILKNPGKGKASPPSAHWLKPGIWGGQADFFSSLWEPFSCEPCSIENSAVPRSRRLARIIKALHSLLSDIFLNCFDPWNIYTNKEIPLPPCLHPSRPHPDNLLCLVSPTWFLAYICIH